MSGPNDPKIVIPPYDIPAGVQMSYTNWEGTLTWEKQEDGTWEAVAFSARTPS